MEMRKDVVYSQSLNREMKINVYGHYGLSILFFPATTSKSDEIEEAGLIDAIEPFIRIGKCKIFCISTVEDELWVKNKQSEPIHISHQHFNFNKYIEEDCVPYIYGQCGGPVPILTAGASIGAYHSANTFFRRPDIFLGTIAISGKYDITEYTGEYFDDNCYYNSPVHYLPNLNDNYWITFLHSRRHIYLASGSGEGEFPEKTKILDDILTDKGFRHRNELWGVDYGHNYKSWIEIFKYFIEKRI